MPGRELVVVVALVGCAGPSAEEKPGPRGLRADQHAAIADRELARAEAIAQWPDTARLPDPTAGAGGWSGTWDTADEHRRAARDHHAVAAELVAAYQQACGDTPLEIASVSPLGRFGVGGGAIPEGALVVLSPDAGPPEKLLEAMRCHRAWMMLGRSQMDDCPLDLPGVRVTARGDEHGIELALTVADARLVAELRRRTAHELEAVHEHP